MRTACREYNVKNVQNRLIHLTNDAIQNRCADYGKFENGNKVSLLLLLIQFVAILCGILEVFGLLEHQV